MCLFLFRFRKTSLINNYFHPNCVHGPQKTTAMSTTNPNAGHSGHTNILSNLIHAMNHTLPMGEAGSVASLCSSTNRQQPMLQGLLYKLNKKSGKKQKYFVIFDDAPEKPGTARLEYFDNEKKFRSAMAKSADNGMTTQKRSIILRTCFNINRRIDIPKHKFVIGLYRKDDTFSIVMKDEKEMNEWLKQLLILQRGKELLDGDQPRPTFGEFLLHSKILFNMCVAFGSAMPAYTKRIQKKINSNWANFPCRSLKQDPVVSPIKALAINRLVRTKRWNELHMLPMSILCDNSQILIYCFSY